MVRVYVECGKGAALGYLVSLLSAVFVSVIGGLPPSSACAQEDFFRPVFQATPAPKAHQAAAPVFSFARMEPNFRALCKGLEADGRRERVVSIAEAGVAREKVCITCRSFWKMIVGACGKLGPRPTPTPKAKKTKKPKEGEESAPHEGVASSDGGGGDVSEAAIATPTGAPSNGNEASRPERYPSTALLDEASRVSIETYEVDDGTGTDSEMFRYFEKTVRETPGLSSMEREYYDLFFTYLLAAWAGRVDSTKQPPSTPAAALGTFFD